MCWLVLHKYFQLTDDTAVNAASLLLHPERRHQYFEDHWQPDWIGPAVAAVRKLWSQYSQLDIPVDLAEGTSAFVQRPADRWDLLKAKRSVLDHISGCSEDELQQFMSAPQVPLVRLTVLEWWCDMVQRRRYPRLSKMAIDIFSAPAMADENERVFSGCRRSLPWTRARLSARHLEMTECLVSWISQEHIKTLLPNGVVDMDQEFQVIDDWVRQSGEEDSKWEENVRREEGDQVAESRMDMT